MKLVFSLCHSPLSLTPPKIASLTTRLVIREMEKATPILGMMLMMKVILRSGLESMEPMMRPSKSLPLLFQERVAIFTSLPSPTSTEWSLQNAKEVTDHLYCWLNSTMVTTDLITNTTQTWSLCHSWFRKTATELEKPSPSKFNTSGTTTQSETILLESTRAKIWKSKTLEDKRTRSIWMDSPLLDSLNPHSTAFQDMTLQEKMKFLIPSLLRQKSRSPP